jgi:hypothetical protein
VFHFRVLLHVRRCTANGSHTRYLEQQHKNGTAAMCLNTARGQAIMFWYSVYENKHIKNKRLLYIIQNYLARLQRSCFIPRKFPQAVIEGIQKRCI